MPASRSSAGAGRPRRCAPTRARARTAPARAGRAGPATSGSSSDAIVERRARARRPLASRRGAGGASATFGVELDRPGNATRDRSRPEAAAAGGRACARRAARERVECDTAVGRQLAAGDAQHSGRAAGVDGLAARVRGRPRPAGQHAQPAERRADRPPMPSIATLASSRIVRTSSSVTSASSGPSSCSVSVVPSSSMPSHGIAKLTRTLLVRDRHCRAPVLATVDDHVHALAEADRRRARAGSSSRRRWSSHGPVAFTIDPRVHAHGLPVDEDVGAVVANLDDLRVVQDDGAAIARRPRTFAIVSRPSFVHASA